MSAPERTPTEKLLHERQLFDAMRDKVIDRSIRVTVDGPWPNTMPVEVLLEATRKLVRDIGNEEVTPYTIDRMLEDTIINGNFGSFYWDQSNKRHLKLNPPGWSDKDKKVSSPPPTRSAVGDLTRVYGGSR